MATITLKSKHHSPVPADVLMKLKAILGISLTETKACLMPGAIILSRELFRNDFVALAAQIHKLLTVLRHAGIAFTAYETGEGHLEADAEMERWALTDEQLQNLLANASDYE
jgi:hypothetical protein